MAVICKNIIMGDGYCETCRHSKMHEKDDSCGEDCPYDIAIEQECIECEVPVICILSAKCQKYDCPHIVVHDFKSTCGINKCPFSEKYTSCMSIYTGDRV